MPVRDTIARAFAAADTVALRRVEELRARTLELVLNYEDRDPVIFSQAIETAGLDPDMWADVTPEDLNELDPEDRDLDWMALHAALAAAAVQQARLELVYMPVMTAAQKGAQAVRDANARLSNEQRRVAATEGTGKARFEAAAKAIESGE